MPATAWSQGIVFSRRGGIFVYCFIKLTSSANEMPNAATLKSRLKTTSTGDKRAPLKAWEPFALINCLVLAYSAVESEIVLNESRTEGRVKMKSAADTQDFTIPAWNAIF